MDGATLMPITPDQAHTLAPLLAACRPHGARRWDQAEIVAAIKRIHHLALPDVILAATRAATDRDCNSPFAITNVTSPHWRERDTVAAQTARPIQAPLDQSCSACLLPETQHHARWGNDHPFTPGRSHRAPTAIAAARAALHPEDPTDA